MCVQREGGESATVRATNKRASLKRLIFCTGTAHAEFKSWEWRGWMVLYGNMIGKRDARFDMAADRRIYGRRRLSPPIFPQCIFTWRLYIYI